MADFAFQGLLGPIRDMFSSHDFESLAQLVQIVSAHEQRFQETKKERFRKKANNVNNVYSYASDSDQEEDPEIVLA